MNLLFSWYSMHWYDKNAQFVMPKVLTITHSLFWKNVKNQAIFVEGFSPVFYACGRFMKYSMSGPKEHKINHSGIELKLKVEKTISLSIHFSPVQIRNNSKILPWDTSFATTVFRRKQWRLWLNKLGPYDIV